MIGVILKQAKTGIHKTLAWPGWTDRERIEIGHIIDAIDTLAKKYAKRKKLVERMHE